MRSLSLGLASQKCGTSSYCFPGSEGEHTYADGGGSRERRWARRSHPVRVGVEHAYMLELQFKKEAAFPKALEENTGKRKLDLVTILMIKATRRRHRKRKCSRARDNGWFRNEKYCHTTMRTPELRSMSRIPPKASTTSLRTHTAKG